MSQRLLDDVANLYNDILDELHTLGCPDDKVDTGRFHAFLWVKNRLGPIVSHHRRHNYDD